MAKTVTPVQEETKELYVIPSLGITVEATSAQEAANLISTKAQDAEVVTTK